ncbi:DnaD domain protein [Virgibacillus halophilus]|uniref:DnaD domain protein n=1 Tax=Tigheibacillus halophilus TaxID=361280 RepID=A0ABU5C7S8_9BACI|nr:DnaD domain protein [Virgibacillus halophilus]
MIFLIENKIVHPGGLTRTLLDDLNDVNDNFGFENPEEMIKEAVKDAVRGNGRTWKFVYNKLNMWRKQGIKNVYEAQFKSQKQQTKKPFYPKQQVRQVPSWINNGQQQPDPPQQQSSIDAEKEKAELLEFIQQNSKRRHS